MKTLNEEVEHLRIAFGLGIFPDLLRPIVAQVIEASFMHGVTVTTESFTAQVLSPTLEELRQWKKESQARTGFTDDEIRDAVKRVEKEIERKEDKDIERELDDMDVEPMNREEAERIAHNVIEREKRGQQVPGPPNPPRPRCICGHRYDDHVHNIMPPGKCKVDYCECLHYVSSEVA